MANTSTTFDLQKLTELYVSGAAAKAILDNFAARINSQRITKVDQLMIRLRDANVQRYEVIALFRKLEELDIGRFIEGRKGHPSRFVWGSNLIDVGKAAQGEKVTLGPVALEAATTKSGQEMRRYDFPLRKGTDAHFELPVDLTIREAERLYAFLKSLALTEL